MTFSKESLTKKVVAKCFLQISSEFASDVVDFFGRAPGDMALTFPLVIFTKFVSFEKKN